MVEVMELGGKTYKEVAYILGTYEVEWSVIVVLVDDNNAYWVGTDSGCSCNSAFEYTESLNDFTGPLTLEQAKQSVALCIEGDYLIMGDYGLETSADVEQFVEEEFSNAALSVTAES